MADDDKDEHGSQHAVVVERSRATMPGGERKESIHLQDDAKYRCEDVGSWARERARPKGARAA
jgi:hypothetical protein